MNLSNFEEFCQSRIDESFTLNEAQSGDDMYLVGMLNLLELAKMQNNKEVADWIKGHLDSYVEQHVKVHGEDSMSSYETYLRNIQARDEKRTKDIVDTLKKELSDEKYQEDQEEALHRVKAYSSQNKAILHAGNEVWGEFLDWFFDTFTQLEN